MGINYDFFSENVSRQDNYSTFNIINFAENKICNFIKDLNKILK